MTCDCYIGCDFLILINLYWYASGVFIIHAASQASASASLFPGLVNIPDLLHHLHVPSEIFLAPICSDSRDYCLSRISRESTFCSVISYSANVQNLSLIHVPALALNYTIKTAQNGHTLMKMSTLNSLSYRILTLETKSNSADN